MTERCIDANVAVKWVIQEPLRNEALSLLNDSITSGIALIAPSLFAVEVDSVVRKQAYLGQLTPEQEQRAYARLDAAPVTVVDTTRIRRRAREIAAQFRQRFVYDSLYAALAESRGCEFWTADEEFYRRSRSTLSFVKFLADFP